MSGFDGVNKFLKDLQKKADSLNGEVEFTQLFNPNFMTTFTNFSSSDEFLKKSPFEVHNQEDFENIDEDKLDQYVRANTRFSSWEEMKNKAGELYAKLKLGL
jgi:hypothetical protein